MEIEFLIYLIISGFGAGVVTGLAGASAATVVTPVLSIFAGVPAYTAITIALFTDVFASASSAFTFWQNGNINLKKGLYVSIFVVIGSIIGSYASTLADSSALGYISLVMIVAISLNFLKKANRIEKEVNGLIEKKEQQLKFQSHPTLAIIVFGILIGFLCGFVGAGGGLMILVMLSAIIGLDTKTGVGTSVLVMTFTALSGGIAHIPNLATPSMAYETSLTVAILITGVFGIIGAKLAAKFANKTEEYNLLRIVAITFLIIVAVSVFRIITGN